MKEGISGWVGGTYQEASVLGSPQYRNARRFFSPSSFSSSSCGWVEGEDEEGEEEEEEKRRDCPRACTRREREREEESAWGRG